MRLASVIETELHWLFLFYALPSVIVLCIIVPPFQAPDELAHIERADQISRGIMISEVFGGTIDGSWIAMGANYQPMWFHSDVKQTVSVAREVGSIQWSGPKDHVNFQNTAQYGPILYFPQAIGLLCGRLLGFSLVRSLILARVINGLVACVVGFLALSICRRGRALTFTTLLLPMTLSQFGSASQDALLFALSIHVIAMASVTLIEKRSASFVEFVVFAFTVVAITTARPPMLAFALLAPAFLDRRDPELWSKLGVAAIAIALIVLWMRILPTLTPPVAAEMSPSSQIHRLVSDPLLLPKVMTKYFSANRRWLPETLVGNLGWTDAPMPQWYYVTAAGVLLASLIAPGNSGSMAWPAMLAIVTFIALVIGLCVALFVTWTPVHNATIYGIQGRYFLPMLPLLAWTTPEYRSRAKCEIWPGWYAILLFPLMTLAVTTAVVMERYYGGWVLMVASLKALLLI